MSAKIGAQPDEGQAGDHAHMQPGDDQDMGEAGIAERRRIGLGDGVGLAGDDRRSDAPGTPRQGRRDALRHRAAQRRDGD